MKFNRGDNVVIIRNIYGEPGSEGQKSSFKDDYLEYDKFIGTAGVIIDINLNSDDEVLYLIEFQTGNGQEKHYWTEGEFLKDTPKNREKALQYKLEKAI